MLDSQKKQQAKAFYIAVSEVHRTSKTDLILSNTFSSRINIFKVEFNLALLII
jgi:hypothetical protein